MIASLKELVGLFIPNSSLRHSHDSRHVEISFCRAFRPMWFLNTIFQLLKLLSKVRRAKVSTADFPYVLEGKIALVAVLWKS